MKIRRTINFLSANIFVLACLASSALASEVITPWTQTSLVQLIAKGEKYKDKLVRVEGYLFSQDDEHYNLFLTKEHADHLITPNSVRVVIKKETKFIAIKKEKPPSEHFHQCWVSVQGRFTPSEQAFGGHSGVISDTEFIEER